MMGQAEAAYQEAALSLDNDAITDDIVENRYWILCN